MVQHQRNCIPAEFLRQQNTPDSCPVGVVSGRWLTPLEIFGLCVSHRWAGITRSGRSASLGGSVTEQQVICARRVPIQGRSMEHGIVWGSFQFTWSRPVGGDMEMEPDCRLLTTSLRVRLHCRALWLRETPLRCPIIGVFGTNMACSLELVSYGIL